MRNQESVLNLTKLEIFFITLKEKKNVQILTTLKQSYKEATFQTHFLFLSQVQNCTIFAKRRVFQVSNVPKC